MGQARFRPVADLAGVPDNCPKADESNNVQLCGSTNAARALARIRPALDSFRRVAALGTYGGETWLRKSRSFLDLHASFLYYVFRDWPASECPTNPTFTTDALGNLRAICFWAACRRFLARFRGNDPCDSGLKHFRKPATNRPGHIALDLP